LAQEGEIIHIFQVLPQEPEAEHQEHNMQLIREERLLQIQIHSRLLLSRKGSPDQIRPDRDIPVPPHLLQGQVQVQDLNIIVQTGHILQVIITQG